MALYTENGTYQLPVGDDYDATVGQNLSSVNFILGDQAASTYNISSALGSTVTINAESTTTAFLNVATGGGNITLGTGLVNQLITVNATIRGGGTYSIPGSLLSTLNGGQINFATGGGTEILGDVGVAANLSTAAIVFGFTKPVDIIDDRALTFSTFQSYVIGGLNSSGQQSITLSAGPGSSLSFTVFGAHLAPGSYTSISAGPLLLSADGTGGTLITVCYVAGTRIGTPDGETAVEVLRIGDMVTITGGDGELLAKPVKWLGYRRIDLTTHPRPDTVAPVRVCKGAFADNVPHRDLLLSPDHAIFVNGKLISARQLANDTTIRQEKDWRSVDYFHVEVEGHAILLAEGLPAESYLNTGNRGFFASTDDPLVLHPDLTDESDYPTREASSCVPFVWDEASVRPVWYALADRSAALGQKLPEPDTTTDTNLQILANGRVVKPTAADNGSWTFILPKGATEVRLISRANAPTDARPWLEDRRRLGVYVERIVLRDAADVQEVPLDHPGLSQGWWDVERNATSLRRWTDGAAVLPLPALEVPTILEITASCSGMIYLSDTEQERRAA